jgi:hypothetical protein
MEKRDLISGVFLILLSLAVCIMAYQLGLGTGNNPGAGFAAFGIAFLLGLLALWMLVRAFIQVFREGGKKATEAQGIMWKKPILILVILAAYGVFFNFLGFLLSTFLLMMLLVWIFGRRKLHVALIVSIFTVALSYGLFVIALGLPLPVGSAWYFFGG